MNDEDRLFQQNPLKAIWFKLKDIEETIKNIEETVKKNKEILNGELDDLYAEDQKGDEDDLYG